MTAKQNDRNRLNNSPLGKKSSYISQYDPSLLYPIPRSIKREEIKVPNPVPFHGFDTWNAYEISWLNTKGKPQTAIAKININCHSKNIIESKSFKLYLNSFNNTCIEHINLLQNRLNEDIQKTVEGQVSVFLSSLDSILGQPIETFPGQCLDSLDIDCNSYMVNPDYLTAQSNQTVKEELYSHLLKSNCLVTGQPDWGSVHISYTGPKINKSGLLKYIVSFREHNEFHEQCVERIFMDIMTHCNPQYLTVQARYTRRGGLDINPVRSTHHVTEVNNIRMARQ